MNILFTLLILALLVFPSTVNSEIVGKLVTTSDCSTYIEKGVLCIDSDDGKFYKGTGTGIEEITAGGGNADTVDTFHASQTPGANICAVAGADGKLAVGWLKMTQGSWDISIPPASDGTVNPVEYSHHSKQKASADNVLQDFGELVGHATYLTTSYAFYIRVANVDGINWRSWYGQYMYHAASEQIIDLLLDENDDIVGIHVTEKGNKNSMRLYKKTGEEIIMKHKAISEKDLPELFENKACKHIAEELRDPIKLKKLKDVKISP